MKFARHFCKDSTLRDFHCIIKTIFTACVRAIRWCNKSKFGQKNMENKQMSAVITCYTIVRDHRKTKNVNAHCCKLAMRLLESL